MEWLECGMLEMVNVVWNGRGIRMLCWILIFLGEVSVCIGKYGFVSYCDSVFLSIIDFKYFEYN